MIWVQGLACFVLWVLYGVGRSRRTAKVRAWAATTPRASRGLMAGALFLLPAIALGALMIGLLKGNAVTSHGLEPWAWAAVAFVGIGYVHCQTLATALLVTLAQRD